MNEFEQAYVAQGYRLPKGITWEMVHAHRAKYSMQEYLVPIVTVPGVCSAFGVPFKAGRPMTHPPIRS